MDAVRTGRQMTARGTLACRLGALVVTTLTAMMISTPALAQDAGIRDRDTTEDRNYANFRLGATTSTERSEMCLEVSPHARFGIQACGTGATWFHNDSAPQFMHIRASFRVLSMRTPIGYLQPRVGLGIAELQVGEDSAGLYFTSTGPDGVETSGPEAAVGLRLLTPIWRGFELVTDVDAFGAYLPHAPELKVRQDKFQPGLNLSVGFGF